MTILLPIGAVAIMCGTVCVLWDKSTMMISWLFAGGLVAMLIGAYFA